MTINNAYTTFLNNADITTWNEALRSYRPLLESADQLEQISIVTLEEAACMSIYVRWLSWLCGKKDVQEEADTMFEQLTQIARSIKYENLSKDDTFLRGTIAAGSSYTETARTILQKYSEDIPLEIALLIEPNAPAKRAQFLKRYIDQNRNISFLPAWYFYGHALLDLGYLRETQHMVDSLHQHHSNALMIDLQGKLFELTGNWDRAFEVYQHSDWTMHQYRSVICKIIDPNSDPDLLRQFLMNPRSDLLDGMLNFDSEVDHTEAELARSVAFINVCRAHDFDNWLVQYELGKLSFQRRRHAEADKHFKSAAKQAPDSAMFVIKNLQFTNLTWLGAQSHVRQLEVYPEILECAHAALQTPRDKADKAGIRNYIAGRTKEFQILEPIFDTENAYEKGVASEIIGDLPQSMRWWSETINRRYESRAFFNLIKIFTSMQFENTTYYLIDVVMRESWDNFVQLWELGNSLLSIKRETRENYLINQNMDEVLSKLERRLREISKSDFQHVIRAFEFYSEYGRPDIAAELLRRASRLAESSEEHLSIAIAHRNSPWFITSGGKSLGLESLAIAEREARDRLERLQVAREYSYYEQFYRALNILEQEGVFEIDHYFEPIEYIVIIECGTPCLTSDQLVRLHSRAVTELKRDIDSGAFVKYGKKFIDRLSKRVPDALSSITLPELSSDNAGEIESIWKSWQTDLLDAENTPDVEAERDLWHKLQADLVHDKTQLFYLYAFCGQEFKKFEKYVDRAQRTKPNVDQSAVPISKNASIVPSERSERLSRLWKSYLPAENQDEKDRLLQAIRNFRLEEQELLTKWEELQQVEMELPLQKAANYGNRVQDLLNRVRELEEHNSSWPFFLEFQKYISMDINQLIDRLKSRLTPIDIVN